MIANPAATMQSDAVPSPGLSIVLHQHVVPLLIVAAAITVFIGIVLGGSNPVSLLVMVAMRSIGDAVLIWLAAVFLGVLARNNGGQRSDMDSAYALAALGATPFLLGQAVGLLPGVGPLILLGGFVFSVRAVWMGSPFVLGLDPSRRFKVVGLAAFGLFAASLVLGGVMMGIMLNFGMIDLPGEIRAPTR